MADDLAVNYLGLELASPVIVGACPLTIEPETVRQCITAGAGAIVLPSILQEQLVYQLMRSTDPLAAIERSGYRPQQDKYNGGVDNYLQSIAELKKICRAPIIASLNGASAGAWLDFALKLEEAGADAIEINLQPAIYNSQETSEEIEANLCQMVRQVTEKVTVPVAVKISQRFTNVASMARQLYAAGTKGLVLFAHMPHWDVSTDRRHWTTQWELTPLGSLGGTLEGIVRVRGAALDMSIAASGGVSSGEEAIKAMIAGADVVMVTSALYREGPDSIRNMVAGIERHLTLNSFSSLSDFQSSRPDASAAASQTIRSEYVDPLTSSETYTDPTPTVSKEKGDAYGHKR